MPLLVPGHNCWRIERAHRLAFLVDGAAYFAAARAALRKAKRSVFLLGWDFNSRVPLVPDGANDGYPEELGEFLKEVVRRNRELRMYVLSWDFAMVFAADREWVPLYKLGWRTHPAPRLSFHLDGRHPPGGSHHQKVLVIDDAVAFVGGLDFTWGRWDTPEHRREEPYRRDAQGRLARPNHDVQAVLDGAAAQALGELCRERWLYGTDRRAVPLDPVPDDDPWPEHVAPEATELDVAIARTDPGWASGKRVEEIRHLYDGALRAAKRTLYLENQYFSSSAVGSALEARLREPDAPEVVVVSRLTEEGWLEEQTMGVLRARLHRRLKAADARDRYRLFYPYIPGLQVPNVLNVHSKVLVVDDELCSVGSANFNNRSMGFDTECNIAIEARGDERVRRLIASLRDRLLAEHLGVPREAVTAEIERQGGSLIRTIDALNGPGRRLEPIAPSVPPEIDLLVPASALIDPERPSDPELLVKEFVPPDMRRSMAARVARFAGELLALGVLAALWRYTVLGEWFSLDALAMFRETPWASAAVLAGYVAAGLLFIPVTIPVLATAVVFSPLPAGIYAITGAFLSAMTLYALGQRLGRDTVREVAGQRLNRVTARLARRGIGAVALLRVLPVASFPVVSAICGASRVPFRDFLLGTVIGMAPLVVIAVTFVDRVRAALFSPGPVTYAALAVDVVLIVLAVLFVWRRFGAA